MVLMTPFMALGKNPPDVDPTVSATVFAGEMRTEIAWEKVRVKAMPAGFSELAVAAPAVSKNP